MRASCQTCKILSENLSDLLLFSGQHFLVIFNNDRTSPLQLIIASKNHTDGRSFCDQEKLELASLQKTLIKKLKLNLNADGFNTHSTFEAGDNSHENHFQLSIIPRFFGDIDFLATTANIYTNSSLTEKIKTSFENKK